MSRIELGGLAESFIRAGAPVLGEVLGSVLPFPFNLVASRALGAVAGALGVPPDAGSISAAIDKDPGAAAAKLQSIEAQVSADMEILKAQSATNQEEAKSANLFISAWRPSFAWCIIFWMNYNFLAYVAQVSWAPPLPSEFFNPAWMLFGGMMGLRTIEKWGGVARSTLHQVEGVFKKTVWKL